MRSGLLLPILCLFCCICICSAGASGIEGLIPPSSSGALPDPGDVLGKNGVVLQADYPYSPNYICTAYTFPLPNDWNAFLSAYTALLKAAHYEISPAMEDGKQVYLIEDSRHRLAMLVPNFQGSLLFLVERGMDYLSTPTPPPPTVPPTLAPQKQTSSYTTPASNGGHWEWQTTKQDCFACVGGVCDLCHGSGVYRLYGEQVICPQKCQTCDGLGYWESRQYVFIPD